MRGAVSTPRPPETDSSAVGWVGSGKSQLNPRYWALELLIWVCGLNPVLNASPFAAAQLAWRLVSGDAAAARATGFEFAALSTVGALNDDKKNRRLTESAVTDIRLETFVILDIT